LKEIIFALMLMLGIAGASLEDGNLTNIDSSAFSGTMFSKDGVGTSQLGAEIWGVPDGWNDKKDGAAFGNKTPLLTGSLAKAAYLNGPESTDMPDYAAQVATYLDERLNRSAGPITLDATGVILLQEKLNVTEGNSTEAV